MGYTFYGYPSMAGANNIIPCLYFRKKNRYNGNYLFYGCYQQVTAYKVLHFDGLKFIFIDLNGS